VALPPASFIGPVTQQSCISPRTQYSFVGPMTQHYCISSMTQHSFIGPKTQHSYIDHITQHSFIGPMTQHSYIGHMTQHNFFGLTTQHSFIGPKIQHSYISHMAQHNFIGLTTQYSFIGPMTQHSYIGQMTQHNFIDLITQLSFIGRFIGHMIQHSCIGHMTQQSCISYIIQQNFISLMTQQNLLTLSEYPMLLCPTPLPLSILYNYAQNIWIKLISSPLLELYIRTILVILQSFDIVVENDLPLYKCQQINLTLRRHFYRRHDYKVLADKVIYCSAICIHPTPMFIKFFINYIFALRVIYIFILKPVLCPALYLFDVLIYDTYYQIILCCKDLNYYSEPETTKATGGGPSYELNYDDLSCYSDQVKSNIKYTFYTYVLETEKNLFESTDLIAISNISWNIILPKLTVENLKLIAKSHKLKVQSKMKSQELQSIINAHICENCDKYIYIFQCIKNENKSDKHKADLLRATKKYQTKNAEIYKATHLKAVKKHQTKNSETYKTTNLESVKKHQAKNPELYKATHLQAVKNHQAKNPETSKIFNLKSVKKYQTKIETSFPPKPLSSLLQHKIASNFCKDTSPNAFEEGGCTVCGKLTLLTELQNLSELELNLDVLIQQGITQIERKSSDDDFEDINGPILEKDLNKICNICYKSISKGKMPLFALANGKWIGKVPEELQNLSYAEQLLVARVRHNRCIVRVSSGMRKMRANAISFANPTPKIYNILPPPLEEMDDVLAFIYTGPCKPTKSDFERIPLLVRHKKVADALEWLKLNHQDYLDLEISYKNLSEYPEDMPPVVIDYKESIFNKDPESTAVNDMEDETGTEDGPCPFVVHGLTGEEYSTKGLKALKAIALKHLTDNKKIAAVGHHKNPESIYNNPQLFPQMMPWLFPYGLGGIGNKLQKGHISDIAHKRHLLMHYDKRFQLDPHFPLIAFNHEQIKESTTAGYLLAEKPKFEQISQHLMEVDVEVLSDLIKRMEDSERVKPESDEEKLCFQLIKDLDHVGGFVKGSVTTKKYMRNEIWSLISFMNAPSWFVTYSPADVKHPISLYFADTKEKFSPELRDENERYRLIAQNPVAGARFFHFMCEMFIKHVLGVGENHSGLYGNTNAYYGIVEQQGRLTLHMHMLIWLKGVLSPQEIRDRIMDPTLDFQQKIVEYLESVHIGEFMTGTQEEVKHHIEIEKSQNPNYQDPTQTLPDPPPPLCENKACDEENCDNCQELETWWQKFRKITDDLIFKSNVHTCRGQSNEKASKKDRPGCINKHGNCKARFPRNIFTQTEVDLKTGALNIKKGEPWINTLTPLVTYLLRCNSDITSLLSGTAIKAIVAYISDYVTKPGLKTYSIFDAIRSVFNRSTEMLGGSLGRKEKARRLITQTVNCLTAKMEIGGPMASLYLLGNPDHYTSHKFVPVYWKNYVREVLKSWRSEEDLEEIIPEKLVLQKSEQGQYVGFSPVHDYMYRPKVFEDKTLYEWVQMATRIKASNYKKSNKVESDDELDLFNYKSSDNIETTKPNAQKYKPTVEEEEEEEDELNIHSDDEFIEENYVDDEDESQEEDYETSDSNKHFFLKEHPLYKTHRVQFDERKINIVPNFVGGSLPRCDRGDREYYCATMLTLFKPWRSGKDLKNQNYSWDETFNLLVVVGHCYAWQLRV